jgi:hypothetical protein
MKKKLWRLAALLVLLGFIGGGFAYWYGFLRQERPMERLKPDFTISADSLLNEFNAGEQAATDKFGGKILLIRSNLVAVDRDDSGNVTLTLVDPMMGVTCTIDSAQAVRQRQLIDALAEGDAVTVKGRCDGMLSDVKVSRCMLVK